jgi:hypothetical protein
MAAYPVPIDDLEDRLLEADHTEQVQRIGQDAIMVVHGPDSNGCFYSSLIEETGWYVTGHQDYRGRTQVFLAPTVSSPDGESR